MVGDCVLVNLNITVLDVILTFLDVIGIVKSVSPTSVVHARATQKPLSIVRFLLFDCTGDVEVNLWNEMVSSIIFE